jgi:nickel-dependent lactate racemase
MKISLPYNGHTIEFDTGKLSSPVRFAGRFACKFPPPLTKSRLENTIHEGFKKYVGSLKNKKILTIVNDAYRRTPTALFLSLVWDIIKDGEFIVATGTHRRTAEIELQAIFGDFYNRIKDRISIHDCYDKLSLVDIGKTSSGTPVFLNRKAVEADLIITINSVEPHFFAGFTGGRKSLIPGLAGFETVMANHKFAKNENARTLNLDTNPLHLDLEESIRLLGEKPVLSIQCVTDRNGEVVDLYAGDLKEAFLKACRSAKETYTVEVPKKYRIVIANCEPPLDINLYQLQKAQEHGGRMVADGGVLITVGACREGAGSEYFLKLAEKYPTPELALSRGMSDDSFGIHKLIKTARQLKKFKVYYATTLDEDIVKRVYLVPFKNIEIALNEALRKAGKNAEMAILDDAGYSVPLVNHKKGV